MNYVSTRPSRRETGGGIIGQTASAACVCWIYCCDAVCCSRAASHNYWRIITCCWCCVAGLLLALTKCCCCCCISSLTCLSPSIIYLRQQTIMRFWDGCNNYNFHRYVGEIFQFLRCSRWSGHVLILRHSRRTMWECCTAKSKTNHNTRLRKYFYRYQPRPKQNASQQYSYVSRVVQS